jgi:hypothetical protein
MQRSVTKLERGRKMANYIDQEILCEAYTHFEIDAYPTEQERARLTAELTAFFEERAKFLFGGDVWVVVEFEEGSLKTKLKVLGVGALLATNLVSNYGSVRQGIDTIAKDSTMLAQSGVLEIAFRTQTAFCDAVSVEKRKGVYGRASDLMSKLDPIRDELSRVEIPLKPAALKLLDKRIGDLVEWDLTVDRLFEKLNNDATKGCIAAGLQQELAKLPVEAPWAAQLKSSSFRTQALQSDADLYGKLGSTAGAMANVVAIVKKKMADRVKQAEPKKP